MQDAAALQPVADVFGILQGKMLEQFCSLEPVASKIDATAGCTNLDAWLSAVASIANAGTDAAIRQALARNATRQECTTSGAAVVHSLQVWLWSRRRNHLNEGKEHTEIRMVTHSDTYSDEDQQLVLELAPVVWHMLYKPPHNACNNRVDKGRTGKLQPQYPVLCWERLRRLQIKTLIEQAWLPKMSVDEAQCNAASGVAEGVGTDKLTNELE